MYEPYDKQNKTGLQPVSRPVEQILGFYGAKRCLKNVEKTNGAAKPVTKPLETG